MKCDDLGDGAGTAAPPLDLRPGQEDVEYQLSLHGLEVPVLERLEARGIYDASRLMTRKPEIYRAVGKCLAMGVSAGTTAELLSLDIRTVNAVAQKLENENLIPPYKERTVHALRAVVTLAIDTLMDRAREGRLGALDIAILIDKIELLSGGVTHRVERRMSAEEEESLRFFQAARAQLGTASGMVMEGEILAEKAALGLERAVVALGPGEAVRVNSEREAGDS